MIKANKTMSHLNEPPHFIFLFHIFNICIKKKVTSTYSVGVFYFEIHLVNIFTHCAKAEDVRNYEVMFFDMAAVGNGTIDTGPIISN